MKPVRSLVASAHLRPASSRCARFSTTPGRTTPFKPRPTTPLRAQNSSLASVSSGASPSGIESGPVDTTNAAKYNLKKAQPIDTPHRTPIPSHNGRFFRLIMTSCRHVDMIDWTDVVTPLLRYQELLETGVLHGDDHQTRIISKLQALHDELAGYHPPKVPDPPKPSGIVRLHVSSRVTTPLTTPMLTALSFIQSRRAKSCNSTTRYTQRTVLIW
jgi:protein AFG1